MTATAIISETIVAPSLAPIVDEARVLLAGVDSLYFSADLQISDAIYAKLEHEKEAAQIAAKANQVHCPEWLLARVLPNGDKGGYAFLIETDDFTVKICGRHTPHRPGIYLEMRSHALHTHLEGARGACEEALCWVREQLCYDLDATTVQRAVSFEAVKLSRVDIHMDWQSGYSPSLVSMSTDLHQFIRPGKVKWGLYGAGKEPTGYTFGQGHIRAHLYNKSVETKSRVDDSYEALLIARHGEQYNPALNVWRLEFQLRREGAKGFKLYAEPEVADTDADIDAELAADDLQHIGTLPRFFARMDELWQYLTQHWLRLVVDNGSTNRSRWPLHPTWALLRAQFAALADVAPLENDGQQLVRGSRFSGKARVLRRLAVGVIDSLEVEDASSTSAALASLKQWADRLAEREQARADQRRATYLAKHGAVPRWVEQGMGARVERAVQVQHRVQMLLGIFSARGVLPLELKPAYTVADLLEQHILDLEAEADEKGGIGQVLSAHFAKIYKMSAPANLFALSKSSAAQPKVITHGHYVSKSLKSRLAKL